MSAPQFRNEKLEITGSGVGGSGGFKEERVKGVVLEGIGHLVAMEAVEQCADAASEWIGAEMKRWKELEDKFNAEWGKMTRAQKSQISDKYKEMMGGPPKRGNKSDAGAIASKGAKSRI